MKKAGPLKLKQVLKIDIHTVTLHKGYIERGEWNTHF